MSLYLQEKLLRYTLGAGVWVGLAKGEREVSAAGYKRVFARFESIEGGRFRNTSAVEFPTSESDWGQVDGFMLFDGPVGGHMLLQGALERAKVFEERDAARFDAGEIEVGFRVSNVS